MNEAPENGVGRPRIERLQPAAAISGGDFEIVGSSLAPAGENRPNVRFGEVSGRIVVGGDRRVVVRVPEEAIEGRLVLSYNGAESEPLPCSIGLAIAENLHPVANPVVDAAGNIYTTRSGTRGENVPVSVFKIDPSFNVRPLVSDIINPTGLLIDPEGRLLISSRNDGTIYSVTPDDGKVEVYAEGMGVATGMALDGEGNLYVGDRTGTVFKIGSDRQIFVFATLEPSISAYHLTLGPDGDLYVTGPTTSSFDSVYRIDPKGDVHEHHRGFGRPQGLTFAPDGSLLVAASYRGRRGVFRIAPDDAITQAVSGPGIVGVALAPTGELIVATSSTIYRIGGVTYV